MVTMLKLSPVHCLGITIFREVIRATLLPIFHNVKFHNVKCGNILILLDIVVFLLQITKNYQDIPCAFHQLAYNSIC